MIKMKIKVSTVGLVVLGLLLFILPAEKAFAQTQCEEEEFPPLSLPQAANDIEAAITNQWGSDAPPIKIFGRNAVVGQVVNATLLESEEKYAWRGFEDPFPVHNACPGYGYFRDADMTVISRITVWSWRQIIIIKHAGGRGYYPGSEGYVQIRNDWKIVEVLTDQGPDNSYYGFGLNIDKVRNRIEWQGRGGCPACACFENDIKIAVAVEKNDVGPTYTSFISTRTTDGDIEAAVTNQWGWNAPPLKLFGKDAGVGQAVKATLNESNEKYELRGFEDPMPVYGQCPGFGYFRDGNISIISRMTLGKGRVLILLRHNGARGGYPGSEGYIQLGNGWKIEKIISAQNDTFAYGYGVRIDQENGTIEWQGRTSCPGCACQEGPTFISVVVQKKSDPIITLLEPISGIVGTPVTITGTDFGSTQGTVTFNDVAAGEIISWADTGIIATVPPVAATGPVVVHTAENKDSNGVLFTVEDVKAVIDIQPDTLNRKSKGNWVTAYIELPTGFDVGAINIGTLAITDVNGSPIESPIYAQLSPSEISDYDSDGIPDLMVKFSRKTMIQFLSSGNCVLTLKGKLNDKTAFQGSDTIRVIH